MPAECVTESWKDCVFGSIAESGTPSWKDCVFGSIAECGCGCVTGPRPAGIRPADTPPTFEPWGSGKLWQRGTFQTLPPEGPAESAQFCGPAVPLLMLACAARLCGEAVAVMEPPEPELLGGRGCKAPLRCLFQVADVLSELARG